MSHLGDDAQLVFQGLSQVCSKTDSLILLQPFKMDTVTSVYVFMPKYKNSATGYVAWPSLKLEGSKSSPLVKRLN